MYSRVYKSKRADVLNYTSQRRMNKRPGVYRKSENLPEVHVSELIRQERMSCLNGLSQLT